MERTPGWAMAILGSDLRDYHWSQGSIKKAWKAEASLDIRDGPSDTHPGTWRVGDFYTNS